MVYILFNIENRVLPPGRKPYGPEAGPVKDPAMRGSEFNGFASRRGFSVQVSVFRGYFSFS